MNRQRRLFIKSIGAGATACVLSPLFPVCAIGGRQSYKGVTYLTPAYRALMFGINGFMEHLKENRQTTMAFEFFDSGVMMKADAQLSGLKVGTIQFMFHTTTYITKQFPILGITSLPGVCDHLYRNGGRIAMESALWTLINDQLAEQDLFMLSAGGGVIEPQYIWSGDKRIVSMEDLENTRLRVVSHEATEVLKGFGVNSVRIPSAETYLALQRKRVDGLVANISTIIGRSLYEQLSYCFTLPVTAYSIGIFFLKSFWERLPDDHRQVFWEAGRWYDQFDASTINEEIYPQQFWPIIDKANIEVVAPHPEEMALFQDRARPIWSWWKSQVGETVGQQAIDLALGMTA